MNWNPVTRQYEDANGSPIPPAQMREWIDSAIDNAQAEIDQESDNLLTGAITIAVFFAFLSSLITSMHIASSLIAYGGEDEMNGTRWGRLEEKLSSELAYLEAFREQVQESAVVTDSLAEFIANSSGATETKVAARAIQEAIQSQGRADIVATVDGALESVGVIETEIETGAIIDSFGERISSIIWGEVSSRARSYPESSYSTYENNVRERESDAGAVGVVYVCENDESSCPDCPTFDTNGEYVSMEEVTDIGVGQCGSRCIVAGTLMSGRFIGGFKSLYFGEIVNFTTASGKALSVTPNHPVLTDSGFIFAGDLKEGDCVASERGHIHPSSTFNNEEQPPAVIEQVLRALAKVGWVGRVGRRAVDFHGDARFMEGEIEVVATESMLLRNVPPFSKQGARQFVLIRSDQVLSALVELRSSNHHGQRLLNTAHGSPRSRGLGVGVLNSLLPRKRFGFTSVSDSDVATLESPLQCYSADIQIGSQFEHARSFNVALDSGLDIDSLCDQIASRWNGKHIALGTAADVDLTVDKPATEDAGSDADFSRKLREGFSGLISLDPVLEISRDRSGRPRHVYDLSTETGWQSANGIIVANCRCYYQFQYLGVDPLEIDREIYA